MGYKQWASCSLQDSLAMHGKQREAALMDERELLWIGASKGRLGLCLNKGALKSLFKQPDVAVYIVHKQCFQYQLSCPKQTVTIGERRRPSFGHINLSSAPPVTDRHRGPSPVAPAPAGAADSRCGVGSTALKACP